MSRLPLQGKLCFNVNLRSYTKFPFPQSHSRLSWFASMPGRMTTAQDIADRDRLKFRQLLVQRSESLQHARYLLRAPPPGSDVGFWYPSKTDQLHDSITTGRPWEAPQSRERSSSNVSPLLAMTAQSCCPMKARGCFYAIDAEI